MDGFVAQAEQGTSCSCEDPNCSPCTRPACELEPPLRRRDGLPRRARDPQLLDLRRALRPPGPHVRARTTPGACPRTCTWSRSGRRSARNPTDPSAAVTTTLAEPQPDSNAHTRPTPGNDAAADYAWTDVTYLLHKHDVSWGYYVFAGHRARLRGRRTMTCAPVAPGPPDARHLEPAAELHRRHARTTSSGNIQHLTNFFTARQERHACPRSPGSTPTAPCPSTRRRSVSAGQTYVTGLDQRDHERPRLEQHRDLPRLGRLGRLLRPRRAAGRRRATATACACPGS